MLRGLLAIGILALGSVSTAEADVSEADVSSADVSRYATPPALLLTIGDRLPPFSLRDTDGKTWLAAELAGKPTVVAFFSAYCGPCIKEIPSLNAFLDLHPEVRVIAVSPDDLATSNRVKADQGLKWPVLVEAEDTLNGWGVMSFPSFLLLNAEGTIVSAPYGNRLTGTDELGYVTAAGMSQWLSLVLPRE